MVDIISLNLLWVVGSNLYSSFSLHFRLWFILEEEDSIVKKKKGKKASSKYVGCVYLILKGNIEGVCTFFFWGREGVYLNGKQRRYK